MYFRLYLLDTDDHVRAAQPLLAAHDAEAKDLAGQIFAACDDVFDGCEVWRGPVRVWHARRALGGAEATLAQLTRRRQQHVLWTELSIVSSFSCVRSSRKLLQEIDMLWQRVGRAAR